MKKIGFLLLTGLLITSCKGSENNTTSENDLNIHKVSTNQNTGKTIDLNKADFLKKIANYETHPNEWIYLGDKPAIIDFYADWCRPCKVIAPILEELAAEHKGNIYIYKIDTEKEKELAVAFGIKSIPSLLFIPMKGKPQMIQGALPKESLQEAIKNILLDSK